MAPPFDPYHRWLGIPPHEQPPNHYRLLGLSVFESDPEVIRDAAAQRSYCPFVAWRTSRRRSRVWWSLAGSSTLRPCWSVT